MFSSRHVECSFYIPAEKFPPKVRKIFVQSPKENSKLKCFEKKSLSSKFSSRQVECSFDKPDYVFCRKFEIFSLEAGKLLKKLEFFQTKFFEIFEIL